MSDENQDAAQAVVPDQAAEESQNPPQTPEAAEDGQPPDDSKPAREAAKYRHQLRQVEAERDQLTQQLAAAQAETLNLGMAILQLSPKLATAAGITAADVLGEDGRLDVSKLQAAKERVETEFGKQPGVRDAYYAALLGRPPFFSGPDPSIGKGGLADDDDIKSGRDLAFDVLARDERAYGRQL